MHNKPFFEPFKSSRLLFHTSFRLQFNISLTFNSMETSINAVCHSDEALNPPGHHPSWKVLKHTWTRYISLLENYWQPLQKSTLFGGSTVHSKKTLRDLLPTSINSRKFKFKYIDLIKHFKFQILFWCWHNNVGHYITFILYFKISVLIEKKKVNMLVTKWNDLDMITEHLAVDF